MFKGGKMNIYKRMTEDWKHQKKVISEAEAGMTY